MTIGTIGLMPIVVPMVVAAMKNNDAMDTFAQYMEQVLYGPEGYYSAGLAKSGKKGDYFTAPDVGRVFGQLLAEIFKTWQTRLGAGHFSIVEVGAGEGRLAADILAAHRFPYVAVERSAPRREALKELPSVDVYSDLASVPPTNGIVFGNELIDAFPVHRVRMKNGRLEEMFVGAAPRGRPPSGSNESKSGESESNSMTFNSDFGLSNPDFGRPQGAAPTFHWGFPSTPRLQSYFDRLGIALPEDYETEVNLEMADWLKEAAQVLQKGLVVLIDYGRPAHDYYAPERSRGTLRCFKGHRLVDPFAGTQSSELGPDFRRGDGMDWTSDVDFTSLALDARVAGFVPLAFMEMGTFLMMGIHGIVGAGLVPASDERPSHSNPFRAGTRPAPTGLKYLLHPEGLGGAFHVIILGKGIDSGTWTFEHNRLRRLGLPS